MLKITLDDTEATRKLSDLARQVKQPKTLFGIFGEGLKVRHDKRFDEETAPDGKKWEALSPITKAEKRTKTILRERGNLRNRLAYNITSDGLEFGSPMIYAPVHQFGAAIFPKRAKRLRTKGGTFLRAANIPARPFLGVSKSDADYLERKAIFHLAESLK